MCVPRFFCQNNTFTLLVSPITSFNLWIPTCDQRVLLLSKAKRYWETLIWANSSDSCYFFSGTSSPSKRNLGNDLAVVALDVRCQNCGRKGIDSCNIYQHSVLKVVCNPEKRVGTMSGPWILYQSVGSIDKKLPCFNLTFPVKLHQYALRFSYGWTLL